MCRKILYSTGSWGSPAERVAVLSPTCEPDPGNAGGGIAILLLVSHPDQGGFFVFSVMRET
jgi:hypothetical protein